MTFTVSLTDIQWPWISRCEVSRREQAGWSMRASPVLQVLTEGLQPLIQQPCCAVASEVNLSTPKTQHISDRPSHSTACCPCPLLRPVGMWNVDFITVCVLPLSSIP